MTDNNDRLAAIRARRAAITPGGEVFALNDHVEDNDLEFIIHVRSDIDFLLTALAAANAEVTRLTAAQNAQDTKLRQKWCAHCREFVVPDEKNRCPDCGGPTSETSAGCMAAGNAVYW